MKTVKTNAEFLMTMNPGLIGSGDERGAVEEV
jgi:hypothetical protein